MGSFASGAVNRALLRTTMRALASAAVAFMLFVVRKNDEAVTASGC